MSVTFVQNQGPQVLQIKNRGLYTAPNSLSAVPEGALIQADNCVIDETDLLESRRGFSILSAFSDASFRASRYYAWDNVLLSAYGTQANLWGGNLAYYSGSAWIPYSGTYSHINPQLARLRFVEANSNLYWTTNNGIYKLDSYLNTPIQSGVPGALDLIASTTGSSGFFTNSPVVSITANTTNLSTTLSNLSNTTGIATGQYVSGTGITAGTTVSAVTPSSTVLQTTGNTIAGTSSITSLLTISGLATGQIVTGNNIPTSTTVTAVNAASTVLTTTGNLSAGSPTLSTLASTVGLAIGQLIVGTGVPTGTYVQAIASSTVTMTNNATVTGTTVAVLFQTPPNVTISNSPTSTSTGFGFTFSTAPTITLSAAATASNTGTSLTFSSGSQVAYRLLWGIKDANNNLVLGAPSNRYVTTNSTGGTCNVSVTATIPAGITTAHFYQLYRTPMSAGSTIDPGDEEQLVFEGNPTSGQISAGTITITDVVPDSLKGATIYTAASQQGIQQANNQPPAAWDAALFRNYMFYANVSNLQTLTLTLLGAGTTGGINVGDLVVIGGTTYTAGNSQVASTGTFQVYSSGTPSQNIANTALSLVQVVNQYATNTAIYAQYTSAVNGLPGQMVFSARTLSGTTFYATASADGSAFNPALPTSGTTVASTNGTALNGLMYSKAGLPEAVPYSNIFYVGSAANRILRILPLRNSLFIFKEREGIYQLVGYDPSNFLISLFDSSSRLLAPDSAVVLNNEIYSLTDQGITTVSESGPGVISRPIEDQILDALGQSLTGVQQYTTGIAYETDRKYLLATITGSTDTNATQIFVFNTFTNAFTRWPISKTCGYVSPLTDLLYLGDANSNATNVERKSYTLQDYADSAVTYTITSSSDQTVFLVNTSEIVVGDRLYQSASINSLITSVQPGFVTVQDTLTGWSAGTCSVYKSIPITIEYAPVAGQNPGLMKQFPEISMLFKQSQFKLATLGIASDVSQYFDDVTLTGDYSGLWGLFPWGQAPWGGVSQPRPIRALIPQNKQWCSQLRVQFNFQESWGVFKLQGFSVPITSYGSWFTGR